MKIDTGYMMAVASSTCRLGLIALCVALGLIITRLGHSDCFPGQPGACRGQDEDRQRVDRRQIEDKEGVLMILHQGTARN